MSEASRAIEVENMLVSHAKLVRDQDKVPEERANPCPDVEMQSSAAKGCAIKHARAPAQKWI